MVQICASDNMTSVLCQPGCLQVITEHLLETSVSQASLGLLGVSFPACIYFKKSKKGVILWHINTLMLPCQILLEVC